MENNFQQLVDALKIPSLCNADFSEITRILQKQNVDLLPSFITELFPSILDLEKWVWQVFAEDTQQWIDKPDYLKLLETITVFNKKLIFQYDTIDANTKASLFIPETDHSINRIFEQIDKLHDDNHRFIRIINPWLDNLSYFLRENALFESSVVVTTINHHIARKYVMTDQYKHYLTELRQSPLPQSIFTAKQLFYMKTCSLSLNSYLFAKPQDFIYTPEDILRHIGVDYTQSMIRQTHTIDSWTPEFLTCITAVCGLFAACCWWGGEKGMRAKVVYSTESEACEYIDALIRTINYRVPSRCITGQRPNDRIILLDTTLFSMMNIVRNQDFVWFLRSKMDLSEALMNIAETAPCEKISLCCYVILGEILSEQRLKELKISDNVSVFFFDMLEQGWHSPLKKFKHIPICYLLKAFISLSKIDTIQQKTADSNKIPLLLDMVDQCPMVFEILWALSFNNDIQRQLRSTTSFMTKLAHLPKKCNDEKMRKITHGILWNLESNHEDRIEAGDEKAFDIMISYSHKDQAICRRIYNALIKAEYRVWIDFDQMHGNVMDSMAQAIEQSKMVLICMSEQYRRSNYCRAEAHYAFQRQLKIVPVLLQEHYQPDGWLLFLVGQLLYVDFTKYEFSQALNMVIKELRAPVISEIGVLCTVPKEETNAVTPVKTISLHCSPVPVLPENILDWTQTHVHDWLMSHGLHQMANLFMNLDGRSLMYMHETVEKVELQQVVGLLQEDSLRRTSQSFSLVEFSQFRSLMDQQKRTSKPNTVVESRKMDVNKLKKKSLVCCGLM